MLSILDMQQMAAKAALLNGVPVFMFLKQITIESNWNENAVSPTGAVGLAQFLPSTARDPGFDVMPFDPSIPYQALNGAAQYMAALFRKFGSWKLALWAYNVGAGNVEKGNFALLSAQYRNLGFVAEGCGTLANSGVLAV